jgi:hypothetical protein
MKLTSVLTYCLLAMLLFCPGCSSANQRDNGVVITKATPPSEQLNSEDTNQQAIEQVVLQNEKKIWEAFKAKDASAASNLLADEVQIVTPDGRFGKAEFLKLIPQFPDIPSYSIDNAKVMLPSKGVAIITYESRYISKEPQPNSHFSYQTTVWVDHNGRWLAIFNQETRAQPH